jgi:hypothetical protein
MLFSPFAGENICRRIPAPEVPEGSPNMEPRYDLDRAAWLWHPGLPEGTPGFVLFRLDVTVARAETVTLQVTADLCYALALDGALVGRGPDSGDVPHWAFGSYRIALAPGRRRLEALVWWARPPVAPECRMSLRGGFACAGVGPAFARFATGSAPWRAARLDGVSWRPALSKAYHVIGDSAWIDLGKFDPDRATWVGPAVVRPPIPAHPSGLIARGWQLRPSRLPEQRHDSWSGGTVRALLPRWNPARSVRFPASPAGGGAGRWNRMLRGEGPVTLAPGSQVTLLVDTGDYLCGYSTLEFSGGAGTLVRWEWAEALYETEDTTGPKGNRDAVEGKFFAGFGDTWRLGGAGRRRAASPWWRSGRYWLVSVKVGPKQAVLHGLTVERTGFPLVPRASFASDDPTLGPIIELSERGLRSCMHEVFVDCPYYEQMMYVADTRVQMLLSYVIAGDDRLARRGMELFDLARSRRGFPPMRTPSFERQESTTFAMIWPWMLRDFALWRDDAPWLRERLPGLRALMEGLKAEEDAEGLLTRPPGWLFADWVPSWHVGWAPGSHEGRRSAIVNLQYLLTLQAAADLESWVGDPDMARRWASRLRPLRAALRRCFWDGRRGLWADDTSHASFSQHAQVLAILSGLRAPDPARWADAAKGGIAAATVYFQHYLFEALGRVGRGGRVLARLNLWRELVRQGFKTPVEMPEPSRSDCHAWGAHPIFHLHATIAGVRPAAPGFRKVRIAPQPGTLASIDTVLPHPRGSVAARMRFAGGRVDATVVLPPGTTGVFEWGGKARRLRAGSQRVRMGRAGAPKKS